MALFSSLRDWSLVMTFVLRLFSKEPSFEETVKWGVLEGFVEAAPGIATAASTSMRHDENNKWDQNPSKEMQVSIDKSWAIRQEGRVSSPSFHFQAFWQQFTEDCFETMVVAICLSFPLATFVHACTTGSYLIAVFVLTFLCLPGALFLFCLSLITSRDFLSQAIIPTFFIDHQAHPLQSIDLFSLLRGTEVPTFFELVNEFLQYPQCLYTYVFFRRRTIIFLLSLFTLLLDFLVPIIRRMSSNSPHHCVLSMCFSIVHTHTVQSYSIRGDVPAQTRVRIHPSPISSFIFSTPFAPFYFQQKNDS